MPQSTRNIPFRADFSVFLRRGASLPRCFQGVGFKISFKVERKTPEMGEGAFDSKVPDSL